MARGTIRIALPPRAEVMEAWIQQALRVAALKGLQTIKIRTARGIDADGRAFRPYTKRYATLKAATGRNSTPPDLTLSGAMLGNAKILRTQRRQVVIGFEGAHRAFRFSRASKRGKSKGKRTLKRTSASGVARTVPMAKVVLGVDGIRPFFHLRSKADLAAVMAAAQREMDRLVRENNRR